MNRRQRRAAERRARLHGDTAESHRLPAAQESARSRQQADSDTHDRMLALTQSLGIPPDGLDSDLVYLTDEFQKRRPRSLGSTYHAVKATRNQFWDLPDIEEEVDEKSRLLRSAYGKCGALCEFCLEIRGHEKGSVKRCRHCLQVVYCNAECQRADWVRHKVFCQSIEPGTIGEDALGRLLRSLLSNAYLLSLMTSYVRCILDLDNHPDAGITTLVRFTCTLVPDPVRDKHGRPSRNFVLQLCAVDKDDPTGPPPPEDDYIGERMRKYGQEVTLISKMDIPGARVSHYMSAVATRDTMGDSPWKVPAMLLALANLTIREDVDNRFKLRIPMSSFPM